MIGWAGGKRSKKRVRREKEGVASLIERTKEQSIILPITHTQPASHHTAMNERTNETTNNATFTFTIDIRLRLRFGLKLRLRFGLRVEG